MELNRKKIKCCISSTKMEQEEISECGHYVCYDCIQKLRNTSCPICRTEPFINKYISESLLTTFRKIYRAKKYIE